jgi:hypothetical protein
VVTGGDSGTFGEGEEMSDVKSLIERLRQMGRDRRVFTVQGRRPVDCADLLPVLEVVEMVEMVEVECPEAKAMNEAADALEAIATGLTCPKCKAKLKPFNYEGYYDEFSCWLCSCDRFEDGETFNGAYCGC